MPARPEGVGVVRQALAGMADALAFDPGVLGDMKMAVTEACTNVVVHAYAGQDGDGAGLLEIDLLADDVGMTVVVRDNGSGIKSGGARADTPALGLGLPLIAALSDAFEVKGSATGGTEVRMSFLSTREADPAEANPIGETGWAPPTA
jgi:anti-sigma regulatory factor (Ser/Thr protein kinase)